jgi:hypothetical protein
VTYMNQSFNEDERARRADDPPASITWEQALAEDRKLREQTYEKEKARLARSGDIPDRCPTCGGDHNPRLASWNEHLFGRR